ncbi:MAG: hypothetical protein FGF48_01940 [Candidatus Brockarchaeota archaeon]|nr:hypothetical protein [Candidatus Brockarchaeota archaeon]
MSKRPLTRVGSTIISFLTILKVFSAVWLRRVRVATDGFETNYKQDN